MNFNENLKHIRQERKMALEELYRRSGIPLGTLRGFESGKDKPVIPLLYPLAKALECPISDLFGDDIKEEYLNTLSSLLDSLEAEDAPEVQKNELKRLIMNFAEFLENFDVKERGNSDKVKAIKQRLSALRS